MTLPKSTAAIRVQQAGPLTLLQDQGRFGCRHLGVTQGGAADLYSWAWANYLAGNSWGAACLEITLGGLQLVAEKDLVIAVTGADLGATLDQKPLPLWQQVVWKEGQTLAFATPLSGLRAYLAIQGGLAAEPVLDSVACVSREQLGGLDGRGNKLAQGDRLAVHAQTSKPQERPHQAPEDARLDFSQTPVLELLPGAQIGEFTGRSLYAAFNSRWRVDNRADRMGVRLTGPRLDCRITSMISEGINLGSVQVPPDGQPIALLNDRQTIGGYPRLGALTPLSASRLAQCLPGQEVQLKARGSGPLLEKHRRFLEFFSN
ncbi:biotin-dependent carboxyltransferase family protein [Marinospirillum perlucidum]|uniref:5-oxoprolinase subunit C family protein n=1 Tax=Marinospirillum perlucidum TaxID=1982602 RepID=UPI000DF3E496|nr:biotin-dependent carboxyltransferase family protein [Marinospirillum perlucidum]